MGSLQAPAPREPPSPLAAAADATGVRSAAALGSMFLLTLQATATSLVVRHSRVQGGQQYLVSVAVFITEALKLALCAGFLVARDGARRAARLREGTPDGPPPLKPREYYAEAAAPPTPPKAQAAAAGPGAALAAAARGAAPMALPAALFVSQSVLLIAAASHLDAVTYQVLNQAFKLIPTAVFAHALLGQRLAPAQWASLPVLAAGVVLVTVNGGAPAAAAGAPPASTPLQRAFGMAACATAGLSSAFAGVYFEKFVKGRLAAPLAVRNVQLGVFGVPLAAAWALARDGRAAASRGGWLAGFTPAAWAVVGLQAFGGVVIGVVVKHCDNVLKNFALAASVVLTVLAAVPLFGQVPSLFFAAGVALVVASIFMYAGALGRARVERWWAAARRAWLARRGAAPA
jgi:UDP-sugar transporter A1/2/3